MNKITDGNRNFLLELVARLAFKDFYQANKENNKKPLRKDGTKPYTPYSLSDETNEAIEMLHIAQKLENTPEEVEIVKSYILKARLIRNELRYK